MSFKQRRPRHRASKFPALYFHAWPGFTPSGRPRCQPTKCNATIFLTRLIRCLFTHRETSQASRCYPPIRGTMSPRGRARRSLTPCSTTSRAKPSLFDEGHTSKFAFSLITAKSQISRPRSLQAIPTWSRNSYGIRCARTSRMFTHRETSQVSRFHPPFRGMCSTKSRIKRRRKLD